jgi:hypothetical protein
VFEEKEAYKEKVKSQLRQWEARLEELKARSDEAQADLKLTIGRKFRETSRQREKAARRLETLERRGGHLWMRTRDRIQSLADWMREAVQEMAGRVKRPK